MKTDGLTAFWQLETSLAREPEQAYLRRLAATHKPDISSTTHEEPVAGTTAGQRSSAWTWIGLRPV